MNFRNCLIIFLFLFSLIISSVTFAARPLDTTIAPMLKPIMPSVVNIRAKIKVTDINVLKELQKRRKQESDNGDSQEPDELASIASGVIVDANNGYILTNAHVIEDAQSVIVTLDDGHHYNAKIIGLDKPSDVALIQIKATNLIAISIGNSNDVKVGDFVAAIGNPFGLNQTVTSGIVSAIGRTTLGIESYEDFIQTDAPINPGNSGGALINMQGQLIGINTAILAPARGSVGIGFAIPINMAKSVMGQLIEYGNVKRGVLGIGAQDITPDLANAFNLEIAKGAAVTQVLPHSPAEQAGIKTGDIIVSINGSSIKNASDVVNRIGFLRVDSKIKIDILRNSKPMSLTVALSDPKRRTELTERSNPFLYGVTLKEFTVSSPIHGNVQGILAVSVDESSNAWHSNLRPGDIITSANQQKVTTVDELKAIAAKADKTLLLNILRGQSAVFIVIDKES